jgi:hypothetical protein
MAFGSLSRIESGQNNPSKNTVDRISIILELNNKEFDYLIGSISEPATEEEIQTAKSGLREYFSTKGVLAYLCDERFRILAYSDSFAKLLGLTINNEDEIKSKIIGRTLIEILILPELLLNKYLDRKESNFNLRISLRSYYDEVGFMQDDIYFQRTLTAILGNPESKLIWEELCKNKHQTFLNTRTDRKIYFSIGFLKIGMEFSAQLMQKYPRFVVSEYRASNKIYKYLLSR